MVFAPFFGSNAIAIRIKIVLALVLSLSLTPTFPLSVIPEDLVLEDLLPLAFSESLIGLVLGLTTSFLFAGLQLAGQIVGFQLGFSLAKMIDPQSQVEGTVPALIHNFIGTMFFLLMNGHHFFFYAVSDSFDYLPVGAAHLSGPVVREVIRLSAQILVSGLQMAGPVLAVTILTDVVLGVIGRSTPQINVLIVGMPLKTLVGLSFMSFGFYFLPQLLGTRYGEMVRDIVGLLHRMA